MARGLSLHLGLNRVDPSHYAGFGGGDQGGWEGALVACEQDAVDLEALGRAQGFTTATLLAEAASTQAVTDAVQERAASLTVGDMFILTFSGYGGEVPDRNSEQHWREKTWALYDRQMPEDELMSLLGSFQPNVRILILDDSSSSGTVRRDVFSLTDLPSSDDIPPTRALPPGVAEETYNNHRAVYDEIQHSCTSGEEAVIHAAIMIMAGYQQGQFGADGGRNGLFTETVLRVWDDGRFEGDYRTFVDDVARRMPHSSTQSPVLTLRGSGKPYDRQRPFSL
jgi:hypothetical protein